MIGANEAGELPSAHGVCGVEQEQAGRDTVGSRPSARGPASIRFCVKLNATTADASPTPMTSPAIGITSGDDRGSVDPNSRCLRTGARALTSSTPGRRAVSMSIPRGDSCTAFHPRRTRAEPGSPLVVDVPRTVTDSDSSAPAAIPTAPHLNKRHRIAGRPAAGSNANPGCLRAAARGLHNAHVLLLSRVSTTASTRRRREPRPRNEPTETNHVHRVTPITPRPFPTTSSTFKRARTRRPMGLRTDRKPCLSRRQPPVDQHQPLRPRPGCSSPAPHPR